MSVFYEAVQRLLDQGLLKEAAGFNARSYKSSRAGPGADLLGIKHATVCLRSEMTDVVAAIKLDAQLYMAFYFGAV